MFGYVRPVRAELKCKDFDLYRAAYCSLCRCLRQRYGVVSTMFLSYDCTFLTLLLWEPEALTRVQERKIRALETKHRMLLKWQKQTQAAPPDQSS